MKQRKRIGEIWVEAGVVTQSQIDAALVRQKHSRKRLGQVLEEMGIVSEKDIAVALARQFGFRAVSGIAKHTFPPSLLKLVDADRAMKNFIFPIKLQEKTLFLAMANPLDMETLDNLAFRTGFRIVPCVTTPSEIQKAVQVHYLQQGEEGRQKEESFDWWTILVVDDQDLLRSAVIAALKRQGYQIMEASNGAEGVKAAVGRLPHLIITDTVMPRMDGIEMFRALQGNPKTRHIPIIALSSKSSPEEEARLLEMGYFDFIAKPINPIRLAARVQRAIRLAYPGAKEPPPR